MIDWKVLICCFTCDKFLGMEIIWTSMAYCFISLNKIEKGNLCAVSICCHLNQRKHNEEKVACMMETKATERAALACKISD